MATTANRITALFPLLALMGAGVAYQYPEPWVVLKPAIVPLLGVIMFGMGITLKANDFVLILKQPQAVATGALLQFLLMPFIAWIVSHLFSLPAYLTVGMILLGCSPGGTASNVVCYLARGDVALSITLTAASTLLSVLATPFLTWLYVGQQVPVPVADMLQSILIIVLLPVTLGVIINTFFGQRLGKLTDVFPVISVFAIVLIVAIIVAINQDKLTLIAPTIALCILLHNGLGLASGYGLAQTLGFSQRQSRTVAIEVGMQNSGLAVALALKYFTAQAALPGALFSIWHNLSGSLLAYYWSHRSQDSPGERLKADAHPVWKKASTSLISWLWAMLGRLFRNKRP
ncbi:solute/sodium symporter [Nitrosococcus oceani ATCC 19707]|uniref:Solute/sodium symporter n=2 Tax=Nitrosococcus oceani TaxID=1229 RepID=Q3JBD7_NITOC|nr:bile acid:sodium symporter family protein [Nitrosococcus oceani]ABA57859.1 solute/sodium symporter [Nitrosococcus oceani ATCC 19707]KFI19739.1 bile acid:sodium symporter [Nitrosococcus oceani C-27]GEM19498.1 sodium transporter [Nitrosococcus oceani]